MPRLAERARTDFRVRASCGPRIGEYRGVDVSTTGILIDRGRPIEARDAPVFVGLEMHLPERRVPLCAVARPVWAFGSQQALKFVAIDDADRLALAEHVDLQRRRSGLM